MSDKFDVNKLLEQEPDEQLKKEAAKIVADRASQLGTVAIGVSAALDKINAGHIVLLIDPSTRVMTMAHNLPADLVPRFLVEAAEVMNGKLRG